MSLESQYNIYSFKKFKVGSYYVHYELSFDMLLTKIRTLVNFHEILLKPTMTDLTPFRHLQLTK